MQNVLRLGLFLIVAAVASPSWAQDQVAAQQHAVVAARDPYPSCQTAQQRQSSEPQVAILVSDDGNAGFGTYLAQYGVACGIPLVINSFVTGLSFIPLIGTCLGPVACLGVSLGSPALVGWLVQVVGDQMTGRKNSPLASILGAYVGSLCVGGICGGIGGVAYVVLFMGGSFAGLLADDGSGTTITLGSYLGSLAGFGIIVGSSMIGQAIGAAVPVAAYHMFGDTQESKKSANNHSAPKAQNPQAPPPPQDEGVVKEFSARPGDFARPQVLLLASPASAQQFAY